MGDWEEDGGNTAPTTGSSQGRTFGSRGRGFTPAYGDRRPGNDDRFNGGSGGGGGGRGGRRNDNTDGWGENNDDGEKRRNFRRNDDDGDGRRNFRRNDNDDKEGDFKPRRYQNRDDEDGDRPRGDSRRNREDGGEENGEGNGEEVKPLKQTYIPPTPTEDENEIFSSGLACGTNFDKYDSIEVKVSKNGDSVKPIKSFEESGLRPHVISTIKKCKYMKPTPIQKYAIPLLLNGRDLMGCAQTGSGKTAAFLVPIINKLLSDDAELIIENGSVAPQAIIVSPTRELTNQIFSEARKFSYETKLKVCVAYGGTQVFHQVQTLMRGCNILVATPGRLMDFLGKGRVVFSAVQFAVLDEADRMLDMGFLGEMQKMFNHETMVPKGQRQTVMFSATFPDDVQRIANEFLEDYVFVTVGIIGGACEDVEQKFYEVERFKKREKLIDLLKEKGSSRTLVFVEQKRTADIIATFLSEKNYPTTSIHGDREQRQREEALADFKSGKMDILVATAVAARGLDIKNVLHVINYDLPKSIDEYVHRIGRTGRVGNRGLASSFYEASQDSSLACDLVRILEQANQDVPDFLKSAGGGGGGRYTSSGFGGSDVRNDTNNGSAQDTYETEEW